MLSGATVSAEIATMKLLTHRREYYGVVTSGSFSRRLTTCICGGGWSTIFLVANSTPVFLHCLGHGREYYVDNCRSGPLPVRTERTARRRLSYWHRNCNKELRFPDFSEAGCLNREVPPVDRRASP